MTSLTNSTCPATQLPRKLFCETSTSVVLCRTGVQGTSPSPQQPPGITKRCQAKTPTVTRTNKLCRIATPCCQYLVRKTPIGLSNGASQNGKYVLRRIPSGKVTFSSGPADQIPFGCLIRLQPLRSSEKLRYSFQQRLMLVITLCCRSSIEMQALSTHQLYRLESHDSHASSSDLFPSSSRQQLPSSRRCEIVRHERNSLLSPVSRLSHPLEAFSSRKKLLGIFPSKVQGISQPLSYTPHVSPILLSGVTPRRAPAVPCGTTDSLRNAHHRELLLF